MTHVITSLLMGGAEKVLLRLVQEMDRERFDNEVLALTTVGPGLLANEFRGAGIPIREIGFNKGGANIVPLIRLCKALRESRPDIVQTWLYHGDLLGGVSAKLCTRAPVIWNLRQSNLNAKSSTKSTVTIAQLCSKISHFVPQTIVCGSYAAQKVHAELGYSTDKMLLIENGFDTEKYQHNPTLRDTFRRALGVDDETILVGHAARLDPQKDHETLLKAAARVVARDPRVQFVLCGSDIDWNSPKLADQISELGLQGHIHLLGVVSDMVSFYSGVDVVVMSSAYGEGAPNVLGEAMSCSTPCVATDVGDSAHIVGDSGRIVPPGDDEAIADATLSLVEDMQNNYGLKAAAARSRIVDHFPNAKMVRSYQNLYEQTKNN